MTFPALEGIIVEVTNEIEEEELLSFIAEKQTISSLHFYGMVTCFFIVACPVTKKFGNLSIQLRAIEFYRRIIQLPSITSIIIGKGECNLDLNLLCDTIAKSSNIQSLEVKVRQRKGRLKFYSIISYQNLKG